MASRATAERLLLIRFLESASWTSIQRRHPRFPMPDVITAWKPQRLRPYPSSARTTPPLSDKVLVYPRSVRLPRLVVALVAHVTRPSAWRMSQLPSHTLDGVSPPSPLSCTCFGDCAGQDLSHAGYKLCRPLVLLPTRAGLLSKPNFILTPLHIRESWP